MRSFQEKPEANLCSFSNSWHEKVRRGGGGWHAYVTGLQTRWPTCSETGVGLLGVKVLNRTVRGRFDPTVTINWKLIGRPIRSCGTALEDTNHAFTVSRTTPLLFSPRKLLCTTALPSPSLPSPNSGDGHGGTGARRRGAPGRLLLHRLRVACSGGRRVAAPAPVEGGAPDGAGRRGGRGPGSREDDGGDEEVVVARGSAATSREGPSASPQVEGGLRLRAPPREVEEGGRRHAAGAPAVCRGGGGASIHRSCSGA